MTVLCWTVSNSTILYSTALYWTVLYNCVQLDCFDFGCFEFDCFVFDLVVIGQGDKNPTSQRQRGYGMTTTILRNVRKTEIRVIFTRSILKA